MSGLGGAPLTSIILIFRRDLVRRVGFFLQLTQLLKQARVARGGEVLQGGLVFLLQGGMSLAGWRYGNIVHLQTLSLKDDLISSRDFKGELLEREHLGVWESSRQRDHLWRSRRKNLTERIV